MMSNRRNAAFSRSSVGTISVRPEADIVEKEDGIHIYCNLPGVREEDLSLTIEDELLFLSARSCFGPCPQGRVHALEFDEVVYSARLPLGEHVDKKAVSAALNNGVLSIVLPYAQRQASRRIPVTTR